MSEVRGQSFRPDSYQIGEGKIKINQKNFAFNNIYYILAASI
jgi:hypothetical protein